MVEPLRHRQTKGAATDMFYLMPPRHISTLPTAEVRVPHGDVSSRSNGRHCSPRSARAKMPLPLRLPISDRKARCNRSSDLPDGQFVDPSVQPHLKKYSASPETQISSRSLAIPSRKRGVS